MRIRTKLSPSLAELVHRPGFYHQRLRVRRWGKLRRKPKALSMHRQSDPLHSIVFQDGFFVRVKAIQKQFQSVSDLEKSLQEDLKAIGAQVGLARVVAVSSSKEALHLHLFTSLRFILFRDSSWQSARRRMARLNSKPTATSSWRWVALAQPQHQKDVALTVFFWPLKPVSTPICSPLSTAPRNTSTANAGGLSRFLRRAAGRTGAF